MGRTRQQNFIIGFIVVFVFLMVAFILYPVRFHGKDINEIYKENQGFIWLIITVVVTIIIPLFNYLNISHAKGLQKISDARNEAATKFNNEIKTKINTTISDQKSELTQIKTKINTIISNQNNELTQKEEIVQMWQELTHSVSHVTNKVNGHETRLEKIEKQLFN